MLLYSMAKRIRDVHKFGRESSGKRKTLEQFILDAVQVHGSKYTYEKAVYVNALTKLTVTCKHHGDFMVNPNAHLGGRVGCPACAKRVLATAPLLTTGEFIEKARQKHGDTYDYSKVEYKKSQEKVIITCRIRVASLNG